MKTKNLFIAAGVIATALTVGSANAAPAHGGAKPAPSHTVTHVQPAPRPAQPNKHHNAHHHNNHHNGGHHTVVVTKPEHHHHHHHSDTGSIVLATAILISALM